jgi:hypothetical protein
VEEGDGREGVALRIHAFIPDVSDVLQLESEELAGVLLERVTRWRRTQGRKHTVRAFSILKTSLRVTPKNDTTR